MNIRIFENPKNNRIELYGIVEFGEKNPIQALWLAFALGKRGINPLFYNHAKTTNKNIAYIGNVVIEDNDNGVEIANNICDKILIFKSNEILQEGTGF